VTDADPVLPLAGVRAVELGYGIAAPVAARNLAQFGADVIRVESVRRPDSLRLAGAGWIPPEVGQAVRQDTLPSYNFSSAEKRSLGLELDTAAGRSVFDALVATADVFVTNMSEHALDELRLRDEDLRPLRPDLVYLSLPAFGSSGPYRSFKTWGHNLGAISGIDALIGWPDRDPVQIGFAYPDYVSALAATVAIVAALRRRDATGEGARLELSQYAMALACLGGEITEMQLTGRAPAATGNRSPAGAPQGLYPVRGEDRWVAVSVEDDGTWRALTTVPGLEPLGEDPRFATFDARCTHHDELDAVVAAWTRTRTGWEAAAELQAFGVPAFPVLDSWDLVADTHLSARDFFHALPHARFERDLVFGQAAVLSATPARAEHAAPAMGEHTRDVLTELGFADGEIDQLVADGTAHVMERTDVQLERPYLHWIDKVMPLVPWPPAGFDPAAEMMARVVADLAPRAQDGEAS
jgi:crotonobetainyl-CoA:carnitine CoA-transferase CaiB-like acyl-CoA transferase